MLPFQCLLAWLIGYLLLHCIVTLTLNTHMDNVGRDRTTRNSRAPEATTFVEAVTMPGSTEEIRMTFGAKGALDLSPRVASLTAM